MKSRIIVLSAFAVLAAAGCGGGGETDGIPQAAPSDAADCEQQTDGTAWQPASLSTQDGDEWQPPTEPYAIGEWFRVGDWKIAVTVIEYDAGDAVGDLPGQPTGDHQLVLVVATLEYVGAEPVGMLTDLRSRYVSADGVLHEPVDLCVGDAVADLPAGEVTTVSSAIAVPPDQVAGGAWGIAAGIADPGVDDLAYVR